KSGAFSERCNCKPAQIVTRRTRGRLYPRSRPRGAAPSALCEPRERQSPDWRVLRLLGGWSAVSQRIRLNLAAAISYRRLQPLAARAIRAVDRDVKMEHARIAH